MNLLAVVQIKTGRNVCSERQTYAFVFLIVGGRTRATRPRSPKSFLHCFSRGFLVVVDCCCWCACIFFFLVVKLHASTHKTNVQQLTTSSSPRISTKRVVVSRSAMVPTLATTAASAAKKRRACTDTTPTSSKRQVTPGTNKRQTTTPTSSTTTATRPLSASSSASSSAKKKSNPVQISLSFGSVDKYKVGMKILLPDSIYPSKSQVPEHVRGYYFEYELTKIDRRMGATVRYTERVIKPQGVVFETFKETPGTEQTMQYPIEDLDESHEQWQKALGRTNAYMYESNEKIRKALQVDIDSAAVPDFADIEEIFNELGTGPHMLELDFVSDPSGPVNYMTKDRVTSQYWIWTHRFTGYLLRRYLNPGGKSFETGRLAKCLRSMKEHQHPYAFARAQHILQLNKCGVELAEAEVPVSIDRPELVGQQVCPHEHRAYHFCR